jgi:hypothetical protein
MSLHFGLYILNGINKTIFEAAVEYYATNIIKNGDTYMKKHIEEICTKEDPDFSDTYSTRLQGFSTLQKSLLQVINSETKLAQDIKALMHQLYNEGDFIIIDTPLVTPTNHISNYHKIRPPSPTTQPPKYLIDKIKLKINSNDKSPKIIIDETFNEDSFITDNDYCIIG